MPATAVITDTTLIGDQVQVTLKLPDGTTGQVRTFFLLASDRDIKKHLEALARPAANVNTDAIVKANLSLLQPGVELDLSDPVVVSPPPPDADTLAYLAFVEAVQGYQREHGKSLLGITADVPGAAAAATSLYDKATAAQQLRFDDTIRLMVR